MRYLSFKILHYRGIVEPLTIDLRKKSLIPIIGINECGKTTVLEAILAFDWFDDKANDGRHLRDLHNLFGFSDEVPLVESVIGVDKKNWTEAVATLEPTLTPEETGWAREFLNDPNATESTILETDLNLPDGTDPASAPLLSAIGDKHTAFKAVNALRNAPPDDVRVVRNLKTLEYSLPDLQPSLLDAKLQNTLGRELVRRSPYIYYFDDFRYDVPKAIALDPEQDKQSEWGDIVATLFERANREVGVHALAEMDPRRRKSAIALAEKHLNQALTRQWQEFNLDNIQALKIAINYTPPVGKNLAEVSLDVVETDSNGQDHFFNVRDRSKGFFWFFNFVAIGVQPQLIARKRQLTSSVPPR